MLLDDLRKKARGKLPQIPVLGCTGPLETGQHFCVVACLVRGLVARADLFRVHNVRAVADAVRVIAAIRTPGKTLVP